MKVDQIVQSRHISNDKLELINKIINASLLAADPELSVMAQIEIDGGNLRIGGQKFKISEINRIYTVAIGKAAIGMTSAAKTCLKDLLYGGFTISKQDFPEITAKLGDSFIIKQGSHPVPDHKSFSSAEALINYLNSQNLNAKDLVIFLISGGGSSLIAKPKGHITLDEMQKLTDLLLGCGAEINEINAVRKHLDMVKGGGLLRWIEPANSVSLILSDVIESPLDVIASGPTVADESTYAEARAVFERYQLLSNVPTSIIEVIDAGRKDELPETVKYDDPLLATTSAQLITSNQHACEAGIKAAEACGFNTLLLTSYLDGEARCAGRFLATIIKQIAKHEQPLSRPACIVAGGETTVTLKGKGLGGRNLETALGAVQSMRGVEEGVLVTFATDGEDGPTDAAGAFITGETFDRGKKLGVTPDSFLQNNDSYRYFEQLGNLIQIGSTGTNVNDINFLFVF